MCGYRLAREIGLPNKLRLLGIPEPEAPVPHHNEVPRGDAEDGLAEREDDDPDRDVDSPTPKTASRGGIEISDKVVERERGEDEVDLWSASLSGVVSVAAALLSNDPPRSDADKRRLIMSS